LNPNNYGARLAKGKTGSREFFLASSGFDPTSPPQARCPERIRRQIVVTPEEFSERLGSHAYDLVVAE